MGIHHALVGESRRVTVQGPVAQVAVFEDHTIVIVETLAREFDACAFTSTTLVTDSARVPIVARSVVRGGCAAPQFAHLIRARISVVTDHFKPDANSLLAMVADGARVAVRAVPLLERRVLAAVHGVAEFNCAVIVVVAGNVLGLVHNLVRRFVAVIRSASDPVVHFRRISGQTAFFRVAPFRSVAEQPVGALQHRAWVRLAPPGRPRPHAREEPTAYVAVVVELAVLGCFARAFLAGQQTRWKHFALAVAIDARVGIRAGVFVVARPVDGRVVASALRTANIVRAWIVIIALAARAFIVLAGRAALRLRAQRAAVGLARNSIQLHTVVARAAFPAASAASVVAALLAAAVRDAFRTADPVLAEGRGLRAGAAGAAASVVSALLAHTVRSAAAPVLAEGRGLRAGAAGAPTPVVPALLAVAEGGTCNGANAVLANGRGCGTFSAYSSTSVVPAFHACAVRYAEGFGLENVIGQAAIVVRVPAGHHK